MYYPRNTKSLVLDAVIILLDSLPDPNVFHATVTSIPASLRADRISKQGNENERHR